MFSLECFLSLLRCSQSKASQPGELLSSSRLSTNQSGGLLIFPTDYEINAIIFHMANMVLGDLAAAYFPSSPHSAKVRIFDSGHPAYLLSLEHLPLFSDPMTLLSVPSLPETSFLPLPCLLRDPQTSEAVLILSSPWSLPLTFSSARAPPPNYQEHSGSLLESLLYQDS